MSYLELTNLTREPFSNSPDPEFWYGAESHALALNRLEIALRLYRGLNVVLGPVGCGKSTLCRRLFQKLSADPGIKTVFLLDPGSSDVIGFVRTLARQLGILVPDGMTPEEAVGLIQAEVFEKGISDEKNFVILIDEGQKLTPEQLEVLRVLLNFETNTRKLVQIIIFAQPEFRETMHAIPNFEDRVSECLQVEPLTEAESTALMRHRLKLAGGDQAEALFSDSALKAIHRAAHGRPRQLMRLGHQSLLAMIMTGKTQVDPDIVNAQAARNAGQAEKPRSGKKGLGVAVGVVALGLIAGGAFLWQNGTLGTMPGGLKPTETAVQTTPAVPENPVVTTELVAEKAEAPKPLVSAPAATAAEPVSQATAVKAKAPAVSTAETIEPVSEPTTEKPVDNLLGTVRLERHLPLEEIAERFYSTKEALPYLREFNPDYEQTGALTVNLPILEYPVSDVLKRNLQLSFASYATAQEALTAMQTFAALNPRFAARRETDGSIRFHLLARASFRSPEKAWIWLSSKKPPQNLTPTLVGPFGPDDRSLCQFP